MKSTRLALLFACCLAPVILALARSEETPPVAAESSGPVNLWAGLKDYPYDNRDVLFAGLPALAERVDAQISELAAKRAIMDATNTSTEAWDFAMQELERARVSLRSTSDDLTKANRENWDGLKEQVGLAWVRTQDAWTKVKASTTN